MIQLDIISGFLGAGKTTFMNKLLTETGGAGTVLVENEFGDVSIDGDILGGVEMLELSNGCICCSLSGNFVEGIADLAERLQPQRILIEPTGMGNLTDVLAACEQVCERLGAEIRSAVTVVSAEALPALLMAGGDFFRRQIEDARYILMSCTQLLSEEELAECRAMLEEINGEVPVCWENWEEISAAAVMAAAEAAYLPLIGNEERAAMPNLESMSFFPRRFFTKDGAEALLGTLASMGIWRAKGFLRGEDGFCRAELRPGGGAEVAPSDYEGVAKFVVIGEKLDRRALRAILR